MSEKTLCQSLVPVKEEGLSFIESEGQILFSSEEVGKQLGYDNPAESINRLFRRNQEELDTFSVSVKLTATDGKQYQVRHFTEEGVYIISMLAKTAEAKAFRLRLAVFLREHREQRMALSHEAGYAQGLDAGRASLLPALEVERKEGYAAGLEKGLSRRYEVLGKLRRAVVYMEEKGLGLMEAAKLVDMSYKSLAYNLDVLGIRSRKRRAS